MPRDVQRPSARDVWPSLLALRRFLTNAPADRLEEVALASFGGAGPSWELVTDGELSTATQVLRVPLGEGTAGGETATYDHARFVEGEDPIVDPTGSLEPSSSAVLRMYLPILVGGHRARLAGDVFVLAHIAQTLDGRIACRNGHSQWISNEANLHHAHRLRALHDAVLVGGGTVLSDDPQLTVRHVEGEDPHRVVLSANATFLQADRDFHVYGGTGCSVLCSERTASEVARNGRHQRVELVPVPGDGDGRIAPATVRSALAARGLHSVFVEGGGGTLSSFLEGSALDVLQVHIAPVVLGSGISAFRLPEVETIQDGRRMHMDTFALEGEVLLELRERRGAR